MSDHSEGAPDEPPDFEVTCSNCGATYRASDGYCSACGSGNASYDSRDASAWNDWHDR